MLSHILDFIFPSRIEYRKLLDEKRNKLEELKQAYKDKAITFIKDHHALINITEKSDRFGVYLDGVTHIEGSKYYIWYFNLKPVKSEGEQVLTSTKVIFNYKLKTYEIVQLVEFHTYSGINSILHMKPTDYNPVKHLPPACELGHILTDAVDEYELNK